MQTESVLEWLRLATSGPVVRRGLTFAVVVGALLIAINHSDAILRGSVSSERAVRMGLTVLVPYIVSTLSSVGALRHTDRARELTGRSARKEPS